VQTDSLTKLFRRRENRSNGIRRADHALELRHADLGSVPSCILPFSPAQVRVLR
jgi:hypothetical protein